MRHKHLRIFTVIMAILLLISTSGCRVEIAGTPAQQDNGVLSLYVFVQEFNSSEWQ